MAKVRVFEFKKFDITSGEYKVSERLATPETIKRVGTVVLEGRNIEVEETMLDGEGMYKPGGKSC